MTLNAESRDWPQTLRLRLMGVGCDWLAVVAGVLLQGGYIGVAQNDGSEPAEMTWLWPRPVGSAAGVAGAVGPGGSAPQIPAARQRHPENVETNGSGNLVLMGRC